MLLESYIERYGAIDFKALQVPEVEEVRVQGFNHLYRIRDNKLVDSKRPLEAESIKKWRKENQRFISHDIIDTALMESSAMINSVGIPFTTISKELFSWLENTTFGYLGTSITFFEYVMQCVYPMSGADPNLKVVVMPVNNINPELNPNESIATEKIGVKIMLIPSEKIIPTKENSLFVFIGGKEKYTINGQKHELNYYFVGDENSWYKLEPSGIDQKNNYTYSIINWYSHNFGYIPVVSAPGVLSQNKDGQKYQESFWKSAYPFLDELVSSFSDNQFIRTKNTHPTLVMPPMACSTCNGEGAISQLREGVVTSVTCTSCNGSKKQRDPGLSEFITLTEGNYGETPDARKPYWLEPSLGSAEHSWKTTWELADKASNALGINSLIGSQESGEAMKMRMQKWENRVNVIYGRITSMCEDILWYVDSYLNVDKTDKPVIKKEPRLTIKTPEYLRLIYQDALPIEKPKVALDYLLSRYGNDPNTYRAYSFVIDNYPQSLFGIDEVSKYTALGIYSIDEIKEGHRVMRQVEAMAKTRDISKMSDEQIKNILNGTSDN